MRINVYTQDNCTYCDVIIDRLKLWEFDFELLNITYNPIAKEFLKKKGHTTVPQLYHLDTCLNRGYNTFDLTKEILKERYNESIRLSQDH